MPKQSKLTYKKLYEIEKNNRQMYERRYKEVIQENINLQKETGLADLRKQLNQALDEIAFLKEDRAKLYIQLEDARNELDMLKGNKKNGENN